MDISSRLRNLPPEKLELLLKQTRKEAPGDRGMGGLARRTGSGPAPLSFAQHRLWFLDRLDPGTPLSNMHAALRVEGALDPEALAQSFAEVARRHEILRTVFVSEGEEVHQQVGDQIPALELLDLRDQPSASREAAWRAHASEDARWSFDLAKGPLLRGRLMRLEKELWVLSVVMHHIASDGWSIGVLARELASFYATRVAVETALPALQELPLQFADIAAWQREHFTAEALQPHLDFWRQHLAGAPQLLALPTDRPRPAQRRVEGAVQALELSADLRRGLEAVASASGATLYMTLLSAWALLLSRYSGQDDVLVGSPVVGRDQVETEALIGPFANTVVRRLDLSAAPSFKEFLERTRDAVLAADEHDEMPFEKLVEELHPTRSTSYSPLFQVWFVLHNVPDQELSLPHVKFSPLAVHSGIARFDLTLALTDRGDQGLVGELEYRSDLFTASSAEAMAHQFTVLCASLVADPTCSLDELALLTEAEAAALWSGAADATQPEADVLGELLDAARERDPQATALICGEQELSWEQLLRRSRQIANHLLAGGLETGDVVAICLPRSADLILALLGVLEAGGTNVVIDPALPEERLEFLLTNSGATHLVTVDDLLYSLPSDAMACELLCLDSDAEALDEADDGAPAAPPGDTLAYILYTSGSTGHPKGVKIERRALFEHLAGVRRAFALSPDDRVLQFASTSFDVSWEQILAPLLSGATLVLRPDEAWSPRELSAKVEEIGLTVINLPTAFWHQWVTALGEEGAAPSLETLRLVIAGGDAMAPNTVRRYFDGPLAGIRLLNAYGPTEAVITATLHEVQASDAEAARVPLGDSLPGRSLHLFDAARRPVPSGALGEIYLGGILARGYLDNPTLDAAVFVEGPQGQRLYRTGDLGRRRPVDGAIEFFGRRDHQVKVRGFRLELAEIEATLATYRKVREAVVVVRGQGAADKHLVAYVVPLRPDESPSTAELREFLGDSLPEYAIPGVYACLAEFPRTASGKVDRKALPEPDQIVGGGQRTHKAPRNDLERRLATIWEEVLSCPQVGIDDNFFDLGGHSLLGTQIINRVLKEFGVDLPIQVLFTGPTVAELAVQVELELASST